MLSFIFLGMSYCEYNSSAKSSPGNAKVSPSSSIQSIDFALVNQNKVKNGNVYSEVIRKLSDGTEADEFTTDTVWTHMKRVAPANKLS